MPVEVFEGVAKFDVKSELALSSLDKLSQESRKAFGAITNDLDRAAGRVRAFSNETGTAMEGIGLMMRVPQRRLGELVSTFRLGFRQVVQESGNVGVGLRTMGEVLGEVTARRPELQGLSRVFYGLAGASERLGGVIGWVRGLNKGAIRDWQAVAHAMARTSNAAKIMVMGLKEWHQAEINKTKEQIRGNLAAIREEQQIQRLIDRYRELQAAMERATTDRGRKAVEGRMESLSASLKRVGVDVSNLEGAYDRSTAAVTRLIQENQKYDNEVKIMVHNQRPQIQRIASLFGTVDTHVRYLAATLARVQEGTAKAGDIQERRLHMAAQAVKNLRHEMERYQKMGGVVRPELLRSYGEQKRNIDLLIQTLRQKQAEEAKAEQQTVRSARTSADAVERGARRSTQAVKGYSAATQQAASSNRMLMQYVQPRGAMNMGMMRFGQETTRTGRSVQRFSMSMGSMVGVASLVGATMGKLDPAFAAVTVGVSQMADQAVRSFSAMASVAGTSAEKVEAAMGIMSNSLMAFGAMATAFIAKTGMIGAEVKTLEVTMRTIARFIAKEAGADVDRAADYVVELADKIRGAGITTRESMTAMISFLRARMPVERLQELAEAAKDFGVTVADMSTSEVLGRFNQFIQAGTSALLKHLGITTTADMMHQKYADTIGKSKEELTGYEKRMARFEGILEETRVTTGVYEEAMKTAGKQLSSMKRLIEEAALALGKRFEPLLAKVIFGINKLLDWFIKLPPEVHDNIAAFIKWAAAMGLSLGAALGLIPAMKGIISLVSILTKKLLLASPKILAISAAIGAIAIIVKAVKRVWDQNFGGIQDSIKELLATFKEQFKPFLDDLRYWFGMFGKQFRSIISLVAENLKTLATIIAALLGELKTKFAPVFRTLRDTINGFGRAVSKVLAMISALLRGDWRQAWGLAEDAVIDVVTTITLLFKNTVAKAAIWGWNLIVEVANGITKAATTVLARAMKWIGDTIARFLAPGSPPKEGPLKHIIRWGKGIMATYLRAFGLADFGMLRDIMAPIGKALQDAVAMGKVGEGVMKSTLRVVREQVASLLADFRETGIVNEEIMSDISESLGAGGEDLMEYIRRLMAHQQALKRLTDIQKEYAEAEAAGFVTAEMKERLRAAEEEVDATKEAVDWQKEFLAAQQETLDLQQKQVEALEKMANAVGAIADTMGEIAEEPFKWEIPDAEKVESLFADLGERIGLGAVSEEWLEMREKIEGVIQAIRDFLEMPLKDKLELLKGWAAETGTKIVEWLEDLTGLDVSGWLDTLGTKWGEAWGSVKTWATTTWETSIKPKLNEFSTWLKETWPEALETAKTKTEEIWNWIVAKTRWLWEQLIGESYIPDTVGGIITWFEKLENWFKGTRLYQVIEKVVGFFGELWKFAKALVITSPLALGVAAAILAITGKLGPLVALLGPFIANIVGWGEILAVVFLEVKAVVLGLLSSLTSILAPVLAIGAAIAAFVYGVWENREQLLGFMEDFREEWTSLWARLGPSLAKIWRVIKPIWEAMGKAIGIVAGVLGSIALSILPALWEAVQQILPQIAGLFHGVFSIVYGIIKTIFFPIANLIVGVLNLITGENELALASFRAAWENFKAGLILIVTGLWETVKNIFNGVITFFVKFAASLIEHAGGFAAKLLELLGMDDLAKKVREATDSIWEKVSTTWEQIKFLIIAAIATAAEIAAGLWEQLRTIATLVTDKIVEAVESFYDDVVQWFEDTKTDVSQKWDDLWTGVSTTVENIWADIKGFVDEGLAGWETAANSLKIAWDLFTAAIDDFWNNTLVPLWDDVKSFVEEGIAGWETALDSLLALWNLFSGAISAFWNDTLVPLWDDIKAFIDEGIYGWVTALDSLKIIWDEVMAALKNAIDTILTPIQTAWDNIKNAIQGVLDLIPKIKFPEIKLPWWAEGKSPPPLATWLTQIADAMRDMSSVKLDLSTHRAARRCSSFPENEHLHLWSRRFCRSFPQRARWPGWWRFGATVPAISQRCRSQSKRSMIDDHDFYT